jgi:hypothetical protein
VSTELAEQIPINVKGSSKFGVSPKISLEKTYNMYESDEWMIGSPGYRKRALPNLTGEGRAMFRSVRGGFLIVVIGSAVFRVGADLAPQFIGNIETITGECFIDENLASQICIVDGKNAYIYFYSGTTGTLTKQTAMSALVPGYVSFHNTYFLISSTVNSPNRAQWYAFTRFDNNTIVVASTQSISTKPDTALAVRRIPGRGNNVLVLGETVAEVWNQVGGDTVDGIDRNYIRVNSYNIDNGCISVSTIAAGEDTIAWLAVNEANSPVIMVTNGSETKQISTDGIDHLMESIKHPEQSTAFFYRLNGHLFYQLTFFNAEDNLTLLHDFTNGKFFHLSDENLNYHIARDIVYFNTKSYFISLNDAAIYEIGDEFDTYNYSINNDNAGVVIPRIRICKTIRKIDSSTFRCGMFTFWIEQGVNTFFSEEVCDGQLITEITEEPIVTESGKKILGEFGLCVFEDNRPRVDMSFSKNGNQSFSNIVSRPLNEMSEFRNQIRWHRIGQANELTIQLRFWGLNRFTVTDGIAEIY